MPTFMSVASFLDDYLALSEWYASILSSFPCLRHLISEHRVCQLICMFAFLFQSMPIHE